MRALTAVLIFFLTVNAVEAQEIPTFVKDSLDIYINNGLKDWQVPGLAVCIIKDGKIVVMKGYGVKDLDTKEKVDENTLFMIGSNTKSFTAIAVAMLDAEKKLSFNDKVTKWIPELKLENQNTTEQLIIRDLLCHRTGFTNFEGDFLIWGTDIPRDKMVERISHIKIVYPVRTTFGYSSSAFIIAGEIIPRATGLSWEDFMKEKIFIPLGMKRSLTLHKDFPDAINKCEPYTIINDSLMKIPYCNIDNMAPAGTISSSVNDLSKWVMMLLNKGKSGNHQIVPSEAIEETWTPQLIIPDTNGFRFMGSSYGLGWFLDEYQNKKIVAHVGWLDGFYTSVTLVPGENLGIIVLTNTDQNSLYLSLKKQIIDAYLGQPYKNYSHLDLDSFKIQKSAETKKNKLYKDSIELGFSPSLPLEAYAGEYFSPQYGDLKVFIEDGELRMKFAHHPALYVKLRSLGGNRFYATFSDLEFGSYIFPFVTERGKVKSVVIHSFDPEVYEFSKK